MNTLEIPASDIELGDLMNFGGFRRERVKDIFKTITTDFDGRTTGTVSVYSKSSKHRQFDIDDIVKVSR